MKEVKFSVCVTTHRRWNLCFKALTSIISQIYKPHEIILIDDDPTSNIPTHIKSLIDEHSIKYLPNTQNIGLAQSRNRAILLSTGEYYAFCDDDDYWHEDYLKTLRENLVKYDFPAMHIMLDPIFKKNLAEYSDLKNLFNKGFTPPVAAQCYKLSYLLANNVMYSKECKSGVDHDLWMNLLSTNPKTAITFGIKVGQQIHNGPQMTTNYLTRIDKIEESLKIWQKKLLQECSETELFEKIVDGYRLYLERKFSKRLIIDSFRLNFPKFYGQRLSGIRGLRNQIIRNAIRLVLNYKFSTLDYRI